MPITSTDFMREIFTAAIDRKKQGGVPIIVTDLDNCALRPKTEPFDPENPQDYQAGSVQQYDFLYDIKKPVYGEKEAERLAVEEWEHPQKEKPVEPVDPELPAFCRQAQDEGITVSAITLRFADARDITFKQIKDIGIDIGRNNGELFTLGYGQNKGLQAKAYLEELDREHPDEFPTDFYFMDDKPSNVQKVFDAIDGLVISGRPPITCHAFIFTKENQRMVEYKATVAPFLDQEIKKERIMKAPLYAKLRDMTEKRDDLKVAIAGYQKELEVLKRSQSATDPETQREIDAVRASEREHRVNDITRGGSIPPNAQGIRKGSGTDNERRFILYSTENGGRSDVYTVVDRRQLNSVGRKSQIEDDVKRNGTLALHQITEVTRKGVSNVAQSNPAMNQSKLDRAADIAKTKVARR